VNGEPIAGSELLDRDSQGEPLAHAEEGEIVLAEARYFVMGTSVRRSWDSRYLGSARVEISDESLAAAREATILDRVHAAMLLQAGGRANALRALVKAGQERGPDFLRLANALSALYPRGSEEKRLHDATLPAAPR
jgi:hypothetical protein